MKPLRPLAAGPLVLSLSLLALPALADDDCDAPVNQWQSRDAVMQMAARQGWQVQRLKIDDGCYELRGRDAQGRAFKAKIDPRTLAVAGRSGHCLRACGEVFSETMASWRPNLRSTSY